MYLEMYNTTINEKRDHEFERGKRGWIMGGFGEKRGDIM